MTDIEYSYAVLDILEQLQENIRKRDNLKREARKKQTEEAATMAMLFSLIIPATLLIIFVIIETTDLISVATFGETLDNPYIVIVGILLLCSSFAVYSYLFVMHSWRQGWIKFGAKRVKKRVYQAMNDQKNEIGLELKNILESSLLMHSRIPDKFLSVRSVTFLIRTQESNPEMTLENAISKLEQDIKNKDSAHVLLREDELSMIERERQNRYLNFLAEIFE
ncbi:hypothetical protein AALM99_07295 [Lactococcus muris]|uniref:Uncharacterized protein n=1 Tax=Lactococcus muris TaxID=2941330 RepID=A0ABV4DBC4_9LACT|nr:MULTISPECIES: hypothetical protein [Lactococcus]MBL3716043.1 hypothetical protein [Lactococcus garvieae]